MLIMWDSLSTTAGDLSLILTRRELFITGNTESITWDRPTYISTVVECRFSMLFLVAATLTTLYWTVERTTDNWSLITVEFSL